MEVMHLTSAPNTKQFSSICRACRRTCIVFKMDVASETDKGVKATLLFAWDALSADAKNNLHFSNMAATT